MELPLLIAILALQLTIIGWLLYHSSQCSSFHERVAKLEEWKRGQEEKQ